MLAGLSRRIQAGLEGNLAQKLAQKYEKLATLGSDGGAEQRNTLTDSLKDLFYRKDNRLEEALALITTHPNPNVRAWSFETYSSVAPIKNVVDLFQKSLDAEPAIDPKDSIQNRWHRCVQLLEVRGSSDETTTREQAVLDWLLASPESAHSMKLYLLREPAILISVSSVPVLVGLLASEVATKTRTVHADQLLLPPRPEGFPQAPSAKTPNLKIAEELSKKCAGASQKESLWLLNAARELLDDKSKVTIATAQVVAALLSHSRWTPETANTIKEIVPRLIGIKDEIISHFLAIFVEGHSPDITDKVRKSFPQYYEALLSLFVKPVFNSEVAHILGQERARLAERIVTQVFSWGDAKDRGELLLIGLGHAKDGTTTHRNSSMGKLEDGLNRLLSKDARFEGAAEYGRLFFEGHDWWSERHPVSRGELKHWAYGLETSARLETEKELTANQHDHCELVFPIQDPSTLLDLKRLGCVIKVKNNDEMVLLVPSDWNLTVYNRRCLLCRPNNEIIGVFKGSEFQILTPTVAEITIGPRDHHQTSAEMTVQKAAALRLKGRAPDTRLLGFLLSDDDDEWHHATVGIGSEDYVYVTYRGEWIGGADSKSSHLIPLSDRPFVFLEDSPKLQDLYKRIGDLIHMQDVVKAELGAYIGAIPFTCFADRRDLMTSLETIQNSGENGAPGALNKISRALKIS